MTQLYTSSRLKVLRRCLREHYFRYTLGAVTPSTEAQRFGTTGHEALEHYLLAWKAGRPSDERLEAALAVVASVPDPVDRAKLELLVLGYHERWGRAHWTILEVEVRFQYQLGAYLIGGKCDAIICDHDDGDRARVLEHKFTSADTSVGAAYWEKLTIDDQVSIYVDGAATLGYEIAGCIYDVIVRPRHERLLKTPEADRQYTKGKGCKECGGAAGGKSGVRPGRGRITVKAPDNVTNLRDEECATCAGTGYTEQPRLYEKQREHDETIDVFRGRVGAAIAEAPETYFKRSTIVRLADELPRMRLDVQQAIWLGEEAAAAKVHFRNPDACSRYGQMCGYWSVCSGLTSIDTFPRGPVHPELAPNP